MSIFLLLFFGSSLTVQLQGKAPYNKKLHSKPLAHQNCLYRLKINQTHKILQHLLECHSEKPTFLGLFPCSHHHNFCKTGRSHSGHFRNDSFIIAIPQLQFDHKKKQIEQYCVDSFEATIRAKGRGTKAVQQECRRQCAKGAAVAGGTRNTLRVHCETCSPLQNVKLPRSHQLRLLFLKQTWFFFFFIKQSSFEGSIFMGSNKLIFNPKSYRQNNTCRFLSLKIQRSLLLPWQNIRPKSTPNNKPASNEHGWRHWNQENKN